MQVLRDHIAPIMENRMEKIHMRGVSKNGGGEPDIDPYSWESPHAGAGPARVPNPRAGPKPQSMRAFG